MDLSHKILSMQSNIAYQIYQGRSDGEEFGVLRHEDTASTNIEPLFI